MSDYTEREERHLRRFDDAERYRNAFWESLDTESDRGFVLAIGCHFEEIVGRSIHEYFRYGRRSDKLYQDISRSAGFSTMCNLAWSLRILDDAQCDCLLKIARLRNHFAHKLIATSDEDRVKGWISEAHRAFFDSRIPGGTQEDTSFRKTAFMFSFALDFELFHRWIDVIYHTESYSELMPSYLKEYSEKPDLSEI